MPLYVRCIVTKYRNDKKKKRIINNPKYIPLLPHCCKNIVCVQNFNFRQVWILPPKLADIQNHLSNWVFKNQIHYFASFSWSWFFEQKMEVWNSVSLKNHQLCIKTKSLIRIVKENHTKLNDWCQCKYLL